MDKRDGRAVTDALVLIVQIGVTMLVPILLCCVGGAYLDGRFDTKWIAVVGFLLGTVAGVQNVYRLVKKYLRDEESPGQRRRREEEADRRDD